MTQPKTISPAYSDKLKGIRVFLSAGFPKTGSGYSIIDPFRVTDAATAAARAILGAGGNLVMRYNSLLTPLLLSIGNDFSQEAGQPSIHIFQYELYATATSEEMEWYLQKGIGKIRNVRCIGGAYATKELVDKMTMMMEMMEMKPAAGIFIGGDEELYARGSATSDAEIFKNAQKGRPAYPIGASGGAAGVFAIDAITGRESTGRDYKTLLKTDLTRQQYPFLMSMVVDDIASGLQ